MKKQHLLILFLMVSTSVCLEAQVRGNYQKKGYSSNEIVNQNIQYGARGISKTYITSDYSVRNDSSFSLKVSLLYNLKPTHKVAVLHLVQGGEKLTEVKNQMNERINGLKKALVELGIKESTIYVDVLNQKPVYSIVKEQKLFSKSYNEVPSGFEITSNIHIQYQDDSKIQDILVEAAKFEVFELASTNYFNPKTDLVIDSLRDMAYSMIKKKEKNLALIGINPEMMQKVLSESHQAVEPSQNYERYTADFNTQSSYGSKDVNKAERHVTYFYEPLNQSGYDRVINPIVNQPVISVIYQLTVLYSYKKK